MEQQNMMPNGMGGGNMNMAAMNAMQRPQNGNANQQIHAVIMEHLRASSAQLPPGWQQTLDIRERANRIMQMVTQLRQLDTDLRKCMTIAENWEQKTIATTQSRDQYVSEWSRKLDEIARKRQHQAAQNGLGMPQQNNMGNMHNMNMQQNMNGMNGMGGMNMPFNGGLGVNMPNGGMGMPNQMNMGQQGFPQQLQRQMQPSPMPPQNQQPQNGSIDPSALQQNPQMPNHMPNQINQPNPQQRQQMQRQQQQHGMNPNQGGPPNGPTENEVKQVAKRMFDQASDEQKKQMRAQILSTLSDQQKQQMQARGVDPLTRHFFNRAREAMIKQRQQQNGGMGMGSMGGASMQQSSSQAGQNGFDFSSMQANAIKSQESGGEVVPASNNNNMMQQGGNQQMNFGQNGGGSNQMMNMQFAAMQEKQKREQMAKKNQMAQQQAMAQQNQLRGQPGGLNAPNALNGGQVNSPAMNMNMLNRPTFPPGQNTPSTPHQNQMPHQTPHTPSTGANQLQQHHQNMLNQNQNQNQNQMGLDGLPPQQRHFMTTLPHETQQKLSSMPRDQVNILLQKFQAQRQGVMMPPGAQGNMGMGMGMGGQQMPNQMGAGGMGNAVPGFNSQPPPNQQQQMDPQAGLQQKLQQNHQMQFRQRAIDMRAFPKQVLASLSLSVPDFVNTWGKLRSHIVNNQTVLPQDLMDRLMSMQNQWFESHPEELKGAMHDLRQMMINNQQGQRQAQGGQGRPQGGPQGMPMPHGQAPQAQMVAPPAQMQQPPPNQLAEMNFSQESLNMLRQRFPQAKTMTDDQIREMMRRKRAGQQAQPNQDVQQNLRNAQMTAQMQQRAQQQMMNGSGQQIPQQGDQRQQQSQGQKRGNSDDVVEIPNPNASQQPPQMQPNQQQRGPPQMRNLQNIPGLKSREELMAMPPEQRTAYMRKYKEIEALRQAQIGIGTNQQQTQNAPQVQQTPQQAQQKPQQQSQQAAPSSQQNPQNVPPQQLMRIRQIYAEVHNSNAKGPQVQLDPQGMHQARELLKKLWPIAQTLDKTLIAGFRAFGEDKIREAIKIKHIILQNAADEHGNINGYLGVTVETLKRSEQFIGLYLKELKARQQAQHQQQQSQGGQDKHSQSTAQAHAQQQQSKASQQQPQGKQATPTAAQKQAQPPLNRKNSSQHARKSSQNKVPPAPTENKTFDWASPTPHGVPKYDPGRTELTADKLKFPPQKKRKTTDSQGSTPAAQTGTPGAAGGSSPQIVSGLKRESPEQMRRIPPQEPPKPRFNCNDPFCPASTQGFESEDLLKKHKEEEHKPIENPLQFLTETVDESLTAMGLDQNGKPLPAKVNMQATRRPPAAQKVAGRKAGAGATPALKAESATPATPASAEKVAVRPGQATPAGKKVDIKAPEDEKTLYETLVNGLGIELPPTMDSKPVAAAAQNEAEKDPWLSSVNDTLGYEYNSDIFEGAEFLRNEAEDDILAMFNAPREPLPLLESSDSSSEEGAVELTPASSVASQSSAELRNANISAANRLKMAFEWDPAGNGDTAVPEKLQQMVLDEEKGDVEMKAGKEGEKDPWDWRGDICDFDTFFGAGSGLDGDDAGFKDVFGTEWRM